MARLGRIRGRKAPLAALGIVAAIGLAAGVAFERTELRGVTVDVPEPPRVAAPEPVAEKAPAGFAEFFAAGVAHLREGDAHAAARAFEAARRANPHAPEVYVNLGFAYLALGQPAASRTVFETASAIAPGQINAYFGLAEALEALGDFDGAMGAMRTYLHLAPEDDPFRRRALSALWEWDSQRAAATPTDAAPVATAATSEAIQTPVFDTPIQNLDGSPASLAAYRGKFLIVNVWATWCAPCRAELPSLVRLQQALDPATFAVVGISTDKERAFTREFLRELEIGFPNYWDGEKRLTGEIFATRAIPLTLIIDPMGEIVLGYEGARDWGAPELVAAIDNLARDGTAWSDRVGRLQGELQ